MDKDEIEKLMEQKLTAGLERLAVDVGDVMGVVMSALATPADARQIKQRVNEALLLIPEERKTWRVLLMLSRSSMVMELRAKDRPEPDGHMH
jgi:hypothetical protein